MSDFTKERKAKWLWGGIIVLLLGGHATIMIGAAYLALSDRSHAVTPNYYERAVKWDETRAEQVKSDALGWDIEYAFGEPDLTGERELVVRVKDAAGQLSDGMSGWVEMFSHKVAGKVIGMEVSVGETVKVKMRESGIWTIRFRGIGKSADDLCLDERQVVLEDWRAGKVKPF
ncbi:FixH [Poriferisphaera corsica]|uniref:FixH n=1 Tax=Poriferisphaera corsica TaxID=2528020 RepID=A0A517YPH2_9BACT|nr:FixH family protein [Poriferisphaera corsica]QDU32102.1 FixH [Poriferisphaera corsica]